MKFVYAFIMFISPLVFWSQNLQSFTYLGDQMGGELYLGFSAEYCMLANPEAPHPDLHNIRGFSGKVDMKRIGFEKGDQQYSMEYKLLGDVALILHNQINGDGSQYYRQIGSSISNGLLGWHSWGWNVVATDRFTLATGFNLNDYFYGKTYVSDTTSNGVVSPEPQGYYFAAGPTLFSNVYLNDFLMINAKASYSFSYWRAVSLSYAVVDNNYPKPHFGSMNIELITKWGLFAGFDYNWVINRGNLPDKTSRKDFLLGFRFVL